jgi:hypothetical protein
VQSSEDRAGLNVHRGDLAFAVLNLYPYSPGHLLICPYRHVADLTELGQNELLALGALTQDAMRVLRAASAPHGFNLGINQGAVAGAGSPPTCTSTWSRAGRATPTFFPLSGRPRHCRSSLIRPGRSYAGAGTPIASGHS